MKFAEVFRFEISYQLRQFSIWILFAIFLLFGFGILRLVTLSDGTWLNAPATIAFFSVFALAIWVVIGGVVAGDAATRDMSTGMHPIVFTMPVRKASYLGARFLAALTLNAFILLSLYIGFLLSFYGPYAKTGFLGPFTLASYLSNFGMIVLPACIATTALQFAAAALSRRAIASYIASICILLFSQFAGTTVRFALDWKVLGGLMDLLGTSIVADMEGWTPIEKNTRLILPEGLWLWNRLAWLGMGVGALILTYSRFQLGHVMAGTGPSLFRNLKRNPAKAAQDFPSAYPGDNVSTTRITVRRTEPAFGAGTHVRQAIAIAGASFKSVAASRMGLSLAAILAIGTGLFATEYMQWYGVPLFARTQEVLRMLAPPLSNFRTQWIIIPLLTIFYAGELIWREREAGTDDLTNATPVPEWIMCIGKFMGLVLIIAVWVALLVVAGIINQVIMSYHNFELSVYIRALFGIQFTNYVLFAALVFVVHVVVNSKYIGHILAFGIYAFIVFASRIGVEHNLLIFGSDPGWSYSDMRGFGPDIKPWLWFKFHWLSWAFFLGTAASLLWVTSRENKFSPRIRLASQRFNRYKIPLAIAAGWVFLSGAYILYNTNIRNTYLSSADRMNLRAGYERRYGKFATSNQPRLTRVNLNVEIYPDEHRAELKGTYHLFNSSNEAVDSIHISTDPYGGTRTISFDRDASPVLLDQEHRFHIYALEEPLEPGDSLRMNFTVRVETRGFTNQGVQSAVVGNGTHIDGDEWMPVIGYDDDRRLRDPLDRRKYGLPERASRAQLNDSLALQDMRGVQPIFLEATVGTASDQIAVAPGRLHRTSTAGDRTYFNYATDERIFNEYAFFSARFAVQKSTWIATDSAASDTVVIEIYYHPEHNANIERMMASVHASLSYYGKEFGPYPHSHFRVIERPGYGRGMHAEATTIDFQEGYTLMNPSPGGLELPFHIMAHEVAHQWWGFQLAPAPVEGSGFLVESFATYSAMLVVEETLGYDHLLKYLTQMRQEYEVPRSRAAPPLLRSGNRFMNYRKGPFALFALRNYIGKDSVNVALRRLLEKHTPVRAPLPTTLDFYEELRAVTPDSLHYLLHDLFAVNTFWELKTLNADVNRIDSGTWRVAIEVDARKVTVDSIGIETEGPMDDWIEIGVFGSMEKHRSTGETIYLRKHRIRSGRQKLIIDVTDRPARAGIDPNHLMIDLDMENNTIKVNASNGNKNLLSDQAGLRLMP